MKILIVEDQRYPLEALEEAVIKVAPEYIPEFDPEEDYVVAKSFNTARDLIEENEYDLVLLDHRMPLTDQGDLEETDLSRYSGTLHEIGYSLIEKIKGTPISKKVEGMANSVGFILLICLMIFVTVRDFMNFKIVDKVKDIDNENIAPVLDLVKSLSNVLKVTTATSLS